MAAPAEVISTARLELVPFNPGFLRASLDGNSGEAEQLLGAELPVGWPDYPDIHRLRLAQLEADPTLLCWLIRGMVLRSEQRLIGHIGFHTAPGPEYLNSISPGAIEFGFDVFEPHRRQGFASEAAGALMQWARTAHGVRKFILSIRPDNTPSLALAAKFGFRRIGSHLDEVDGLEEIFERIVE